MDCSQYFSVSPQIISFLPVQCTCFDNLSSEVNGACELPGGCGKESCIVSRPVYWQSDETFYWFLILRHQFTIPTWSLIMWFVSLSHLVYTHHWWIMPKIMLHFHLFIFKKTPTTTNCAARTLINCMKVVGGNLLILKLLILLRSKPFWR